MIPYDAFLRPNLVASGRRAPVTPVPNHVCRFQGMLKISLARITASHTNLTVLH